MGKNEELETAMDLRARLLAGNCSFQTEIVADYGDKLYTFGMRCEADSRGAVGFQVIAPDSIAGISGNASSDGGMLTFDDASLAFPLLADGQLSPVSAPYVLINTLRGGYVRSAGKDGDLVLVTIDDSYDEDALQLDIWLDAQGMPVRGEILFDGRRILSMTISDFRIS